MLIPTLPVYVKEIVAQVQISDLLSACLPLRLFVRPLTGNALQKFNKKSF